MIPNGELEGGEYVPRPGLKLQFKDMDLSSCFWSRIRDNIVCKISINR